MNKETFRKWVVNINKFYASNISLAIFLSITAIFSIIQISLYVTSKIEMNGSYWNEIGGDTKAITMAWVTISLGLLSCFTGFIGAIMNMRGNTLFVYWASINFLCSAITAFMASAILMCIAFIISFLLSWFRYFVWKNNLLEKWDLNMKKVWIWISIFFLLTLGIFLTIEATAGMISDDFGNLMHYFPGDNEPKAKWTWYADAIGATFLIFGSVIITLKNRMAFVIYFIAKIFGIATYAYAGQIIPIVQMSIFFTTDITGFIAWSHHLLKD